MSESYSGSEASAPVDARTRLHDVIGRLLPGADAELLLSALDAERSQPDVDVSHGEHADRSEDPASRELHRVRRQYALGESARTAQHELNNPLTALLAEAQLLELEPLAVEHRAAVGRIVALARRLAAVARRFEPGGAPTLG
jgi:signal transduction histidine kinase